MKRLIFCVCAVAFSTTANAQEDPAVDAGTVLEATECAVDEESTEDIGDAVADVHDYVVHPLVVDATIRESLARESVFVDEDHRYDSEVLLALATAIATECEDRACVIAALATGWQETRWRPHARGRSGECGFAQQSPNYGDDIPELENVSDRERCRLLQQDQSVAVRQWHTKRAQRMARYGDRWPCHYNSGHVCTEDGQHYQMSHMRFRRMYENILPAIEESFASLEGSR